MIKYVTKFFTASDWDYYDAGQLRFGTLEQYAAIENKKILGSRYDSSEGESSKVSRFSGPVHKGLSVGNAIYFDGGPYGRAEIQNLQTNHSHNEWVWCASTGKYTEEQHKAIQIGCGTYPGDKRLSCWAVFDLEILMNALAAAILSQPQIKAKPKDMILADVVTYDKEQVFIDLIIDGEHQQSYSAEDAHRLFFRKPAFFAPESEFRIVLGFNFPYSAPRNAVARIVSSDNIRESIVQISPRPLFLA